MSDPLRKVKVGDGAGRAFDTQTFNTFIDAAKFFKGRMSTRVGAGPPDLEQQVPSCRVWIRNTTGSTLLPWSCVVPTGVAPIDPETLPFNANEQPVFEVQAPTATTDPVLITMQPIAAGELGEAAALGVCVAQVNVTDGAHRFAVPVVGSTASLASASSGPVRILAPWNTGNTSRLVMLCGQGAGGGGSITVEEVDGSPSYGSITTLRFDQADGFVLSQPGAGIARVDLPYSGATVFKNITKTISNNTPAAIDCDQEVFDTSAYHDTITNNTRLTVPATGLYLLQATIPWDFNVTGLRVIWIQHSGGQTVCAASQTVTAAGVGTVGYMNCGGVWVANAGEYFECWVNQSTGSSLNCCSTTNRFSIARIY